MGKVKQAVAKVKKLLKSGKRGKGKRALVPQRVSSTAMLSAADAMKPDVLQAYAKGLCGSLPTEFKILPPEPYVHDKLLPDEAPQPGFVKLPCPLTDLMDDGSAYVWHSATIIDGKLVLQGQQQERAPKTRVFAGRGRDLGAELKREQERIEKAEAEGKDPNAHVPVAQPGILPPALVEKGLVEAGSKPAGLFFRHPTFDDRFGLGWGPRELAEYVILTSLGLYTSTRYLNLFSKSSVDSGSDGREVQRADRAPVGLYPSGPGGLY